MFDLLIAGGQVYDGSGEAPYLTDVGIADGRVVALGDLSGAEATRTLDATGKAVAPGFIDIHSHADLSLIVDPLDEPKLRQGVTTELVGQCGLGPAPTVPATAAAWRDSLSSVLGDRPAEWTWPTFAAYLDDLSRARPAVNVGALATHGAIRAAVLGLDDRAPTPAQQAAMEQLAETALDDGAFGLSTGLVYLPCLFAERDELVGLYRRVAAHDKLMAIHIRGQAGQVLDALDEGLGIARAAEVSLQVSHLCAVGRPNWGKPARMLEKIDRARGQGQDVTFDQHPYDAASTTLTQTMPGWAVAGGGDALVTRLSDPATRARIKRELAEDSPTNVDPRVPWQNYAGLVGWENILITAVHSERNAACVGRSVAAIAGERRREPVEAAFDLLIEEQGAVAMVLLDAYSPSDLAQVMRHEAQMVGSDSIYTGTPHPRLYGSFPRVLGRFAREDGVISLAQAVRKMTAVPAARLGLGDRGVIREGAAADVVVFDPATVRDLATYAEPRQFPVGIEHVVVNGVLAVDSGNPTGARAGQVLRK
ncbi:MAG: N-acyl-D-amino-acid deacylase family protein [Chloroflexota bacterium]